MEETQLDLVANDIMNICKVKVKTPEILYELREYIIVLEKDIILARKLGYGLSLFKE